MTDINKHWGEHPKDVDNPEWQLVKINVKGIKVSWKDEMFTEHQEECVGLWFSAKKNQYMLTWKDAKKIYIEKSNINSLQVEDVC